MRKISDWICDQSQAAIYESDAESLSSDVSSLRQSSSMKQIVEGAHDAHSSALIEMAFSLNKEKAAIAKSKILEIEEIVPPDRTVDVCFGKVSPSVCRYLVRAIELDCLFGLDGKDIIEVGAGWGGLCAIIHKLFSVRSYSIFDLPSVCSAQKIVLSKMDIFPSFPESAEERQADLFISDFAFSELTLQGQLEYKPVMSSCKSGAIMAPSFLGSGRTHTPAQMQQRLTELSAANVVWGCDHSHYINLARLFGDIRILDSYLWSR